MQNPSVAGENATEGEGIQNTPIADNITGERTETAGESAAEGAEFFTEATPEMDEREMQQRMHSTQCPNSWKALA